MRRILVVNDEPDSREAICELLRMAGHDVLQAADGETGLLLASRERPEVILLDLGLPDLDGYEVARRLRAAPGGQCPFLIGLTGYPRGEVLEQMLASGFDEHLLKTTDPDRLEELVARAFRPA